ncbi:hypothetical protein Tco_0529375 [Tanacetum coccineum]
MTAWYFANQSILIIASKLPSSTGIKLMLNGSPTSYGPDGPYVPPVAFGRTWTIMMIVAFRTQRLGPAVMFLLPVPCSVSFASILPLIRLLLVLIVLGSVIQLPLVLSLAFRKSAALFVHTFLKLHYWILILEVSQTSTLITGVSSLIPSSSRIPTLLGYVANLLAILDFQYIVIVCAAANSLMPALVDGVRGKLTYQSQMPLFSSLEGTGISVGSVEDDSFSYLHRPSGRMSTGSHRDYEWYEALEDSKLKDLALRNKAIMKGVINEDDDESCYEQNRRWNIYTNYDDVYEINHRNNEREELCEIHELPVCNIRRYTMINYSFNNEEEYVAVKEDEYDDLTITRKEAYQAYQEIFRIMDEGWMVSRAE